MLPDSMRLGVLDGDKAAVLNGSFPPESDIGDRHRPLVDALAWHE